MINLSMFHVCHSYCVKTWINYVKRGAFVIGVDLFLLSEANFLYANESVNLLQKDLAVIKFSLTFDILILHGFLNLNV